MTKQEIVRNISEEIGLTQQKTKRIVGKCFEAIIQTLASEGRIELRNFGVFEVKTRKAYEGRNPLTGEVVLVPEREIVTFKAGKAMEERVEALHLHRQRKAEAAQPDAPLDLSDPALLFSDKLATQARRAND